MSDEINHLSLLPCAFCGGEAKAFLSFHGNSSFVKCMNRACEVYTPPILIGENVTTIWNTRSIPELPPVSPEDLVEGEWYVVRDSSGEEHVVYCVIDPDEGPGLYALDVCFEAGWNLKNVPIYGPLRFKIGGAE